jgi:hypothetical protein
VSKFIAENALLSWAFGNKMPLFSTMIALHIQQNWACNCTVFVGCLADKVRIVFGFGPSILLANWAERFGSVIIIIGIGVVFGIFTEVHFFIDLL